MDHKVLAATCISVLAFGSLVTATETMEDLWHAMETVRLNSNPYIPPVDNGPVEVSMSLDLTSIREVDTDRGEVEIFAMLSHSWNSPRLSWGIGPTNGSESQHVSSVDSFVIDVSRIWSPDIVAYNAANAPELLSPPLALITEKGLVYYIPNQRIRFRCNLVNLDSSEGANCTLKYGSWTHNGNRIALKDNGVSLWDYVESPRFQLLGVYSEVEVNHYPCCSEPYPDVKFTLNFKKRSQSLFDW